MPTVLSKLEGLPVEIRQMIVSFVIGPCTMKLKTDSGTQDETEPVLRSTVTHQETGPTSHDHKSVHCPFGYPFDALNLSQASHILAVDTYLAIAKLVDFCRENAKVAKHAAVEDSSKILRKFERLRQIHLANNLPILQPPQFTEELKISRRLQATTLLLEDESEHRDIVLGVFQDITTAWETSRSFRKDGVSPEARVVLADMNRIAKLAHRREWLIRDAR